MQEYLKVVNSDMPLLLSKKKLKENIRFFLKKTLSYLEN